MIKFFHNLIKTCYNENGHTVRNIIPAICFHLEMRSKVEKGIEL